MADRKKPNRSPLEAIESILPLIPKTETAFRDELGRCATSALYAAPEAHHGLFARAAIALGTFLGPPPPPLDGWREEVRAVWSRRGEEGGSLSTMIDSALVLVDGEVVTFDGTSRLYNLGSDGWPGDCGIAMVFEEPFSVFHGGLEVGIRFHYQPGPNLVAVPREVGSWSPRRRGKAAIVLPADPNARAVDLRYWLEGVAPTARLTAWIEPRPVEIVEPASRDSKDWVVVMRHACSTQHWQFGR